MKDSLLVNTLRALRLHRIAWSARRLYCPVDKSALVLEVGSGGNPYFRANVLLDAYEETRERLWAPLIKDRPFLIGFVERLPFADNTFDFVIASHVLEHSAFPEKFLAELQRVAKCGYIEVPDAFMERLNPYRDHRLEVTERHNGLRIRKKESWCVDEELRELYEHRAKRVITQGSMRQNPFEYHLRYYWQDVISHTIINPDVNCNWKSPQDVGKAVPSSLLTSFKSLTLSIIRKIFSQNARNSKIDLISLLRCPECHGNLSEKTKKLLKCQGCDLDYAIKDSVPIMTTT